MMKFPETKIEPLSFKDKLGQPLNIYSTTFTGIAYTLFIVSILIGLIGIILTIDILLDFDEERVIFALFFTPAALIPFYIYIGNRFRYIATFSEGIVIKRRFKFDIIKYLEIEKNELKNISVISNLLRNDLNQELAIDIILKNGRFISIGESSRILRIISYPRIPTGIRILNIKELYIELEQNINSTAHN